MGPRPSNVSQRQLIIASLKARTLASCTANTASRVYQHTSEKAKSSQYPIESQQPDFPDIGERNGTQTQTFPDLPPQPFLLVSTWTHTLGSSIDPRNDAKPAQLVNSHPNSDSRQLRPLIPVQPNCTLPRPTRLPISFSRYPRTLPTVATTSPKSTSTPASHVPHRKYTLFVRPSRRHEVYHVRPGHD